VKDVLLLLLKVVLMMIKFIADVVVGVFLLVIGWWKGKWW